MSPPQKKRNATPQELLLWHQIMDDTKPFSGPKKNTSSDPMPNISNIIMPIFPAITPSPITLPAKPVATRVEKKTHTYFPSLNKKTVRKISRNVQTIDAQLDLHGMTQGKAWSSLINFLTHCSATEKRFLLIITGKGIQRKRDQQCLYENPITKNNYGVLRTLLPRWLTQSPHCKLVLSVTSAHPRHGGDGAFYVQLRRHK